MSIRRSAQSPPSARVGGRINVSADHEVFFLSIIGFVSDRAPPHLRNEIANKFRRRIGENRPVFPLISSQGKAFLISVPGEPDGNDCQYKGYKIVAVMAVGHQASVLSKVTVVTERRDGVLAVKKALSKVLVRHEFHVLPTEVGNCFLSVKRHLAVCIRNMNAATHIDEKNRHLSTLNIARMFMLDKLDREGGVHLKRRWRRYLGGSLAPIS